jgi:protocatechuate 3,4-dioxygenase beta subunit
MERRTFLQAIPVMALATAWGRDADAQDLEWVQAWERTQRARPASLSPRARIAPPGEPGAPLVIHGRVFAGDGRTAAPDVTVFAYHTDARGHYDGPNGAPHAWRLRGWARTGHDGRFEFDTIRPGAYPSRAVAEHVHFTIDGPGLQRRWTPELNFQDDRLVGAADRETSRRAGPFGSVRPVTTRDGVQHVEFNIRIVDRDMF